MECKSQGGRRCSAEDRDPKGRERGGVLGRGSEPPSPTSNLHKLQMVQNALARTITRSPRSVPTSKLLSNLHWLPIHKRINTNFKVATLTYKVLTTQQPAYLHNLISYHQPSRLLRSSSQSLLHVPRAKPTVDVVLSPLLLPKSGTIYLPPLKSHHHLTPSNVTSKHTILPLHSFLTT